MTRHETNDRENPVWWSGITSSLPRCHLLGSMTAIALLACIAWVWSRNNIAPTSIQYGEQTIDLNDAATLVDNADQWRQLYTINYERSQAIDQQTKSIAGWLPPSVDWPSTERDIRSISQSANLTVLSIKQGDRFVGRRVGVLSARCEVQGSYGALCRFLSDLSTRSQPIACSQIDLRRTGEMTLTRDGRRATLCKATLSLRIPFAADQTAAGRLRMSGKNHDS